MRQDLLNAMRPTGDGANHAAPVSEICRIAGVPEWRGYSVLEALKDEPSVSPVDAIGSKKKHYPIGIWATVLLPRMVTVLEKKKQPIATIRRVRKVAETWRRIDDELTAVFLADQIRAEAAARAAWSNGTRDAIVEHLRAVKSTYGGLTTFTDDDIAYLAMNPGERARADAELDAEIRGARKGERNVYRQLARAIIRAGVQRADLFRRALGRMWNSVAPELPDDYRPDPGEDFKALREESRAANRRLAGK